MIFHSGLDFILHIRNVTKTGFYQLITSPESISLSGQHGGVDAFISSRTDYCDVLLSGLL